MTCMFNQTNKTLPCIFSSSRMRVWFRLLHWNDSLHHTVFECRLLPCSLHLENLSILLVTCSADFALPKHYFSSDKQYFYNHNNYFSHLAYTVFDYSVFLYIQTAKFNRMNFRSIYYKDYD